MASGPHTFTTLSIFTPTRFEGSRAAVVSPRGPRDLPPLHSVRRARLAAELNTDTVAFLYDAPAFNQPRILDVYILAAAHFIFQHVEQRSGFNLVGLSDHSNNQQTTILRIADSTVVVPVFFNPYRQVAACAVPDITNLLKLDGAKVSWAKIAETQAGSKNLAEIEKVGQDKDKNEYPVVSLGRQSWALVDVSGHVDVLKDVERRGVADVDGQVHGLVWFAQQRSQVGGKNGEPAIDGLVIRVLHNGWEEEASANAAAALAAWLSLEPKKEEDLAGEVERLSVTQDASATCLQADALQTGSALAGAIDDAGQSPSATDVANFINFCAGRQLTNGIQVQGGSCNGIPMGNIPSTGNMISTVITFPTGAADEEIGANEAFTIRVQTSNLEAGVFTNPDTTYYSAPQDLQGGNVVGHTHVTVQDTGGSLPTSPLDPGTFAFFKGINTPVDNNGELTADVTEGLPAGFYRICTMTSAANHQPVLMPVSIHLPTIN
ncbi:hypothetical protein DV735_g4562, partial [Chaetothyriales sp. CBS 134920]